MKKLLTLSISMLLVLGLVTGCGCNKKEETKKDENYNTNTGVIEDKEVRIFNIYVKDKDGNEIVTLQGYVGGVVPAGQSREIESNVDMNLDHAHTIEYEILK